MKMSSVDWLAWVLVVVGAFNWGFVGIASVNLVELILGTGALTQVVYLLIGLAGVYMLWMALSKKK
jgi:hypothetical protein